MLTTRPPKTFTFVYAFQNSLLLDNIKAHVFVFNLLCKNILFTTNFKKLELERVRINFRTLYVVCSVSDPRDECFYIHTEGPIWTLVPTRSFRLQQQEQVESTRSCNAGR
jgi:hypothetical protein